MARTYATPAQYEAYTGQTPVPSDISRLLADASRMLEARVFRLCWYDTDPDTGLPSNPLVTAAFSDAVCAQAQWWDEVGDSTGAASAGWGTVRIGSAQLSRSVTDVSGEAAASRQLAPKVVDALMSPDLTADIFRLGEVSTW
jgi:hypothetical protein